MPGLGLGLGLGLSGGRRLTNPNEIANLELWYTAAAGFLYTDAGTTLAGIGDSVQRMITRITSGSNHANQTTAANRPIFRADGLEFDATNDFMAFTPVQFTGDFTFYAVGLMTAGQGWVPFGNDSVGAFAAVQRFTDNKAYVSNDVAATVNSAWNSAVKSVIRVRRASGTVFIKVTGVAESGGSALAGNLTFNNIAVRVTSGHRNSSTAHRYNEWLMYSRNLTAGERASVEAYLMSSQGVGP